MKAWFLLEVLVDKLKLVIKIVIEKGNVFIRFGLRMIENYERKKKVIHQTELIVFTWLISSFYRNFLIVGKYKILSLLALVRLKIMTDAVLFTPCV